MSARKCPACNKVARKWACVLLLSDANRRRGRLSMKGSLVCAACADSGITVVAPKFAPATESGNAERKEQREVLAPFIKNLKAKLSLRKVIAAKEYAADAEDDPVKLHAEGYTQALEDVLAMLKEGRA